MSKHTMGAKLPRKLAQQIQIVDEQIELACLRRNLTVVQVADSSSLTKRGSHTETPHRLIRISRRS